MKVLIVLSGNKNNQISPFVLEQVYSLKKLDIEIVYFQIIGKGFFGYLKNLKRLKNEIKNLKVDLIHAHYGLAGFLAVLQRKVPVAVTYHGTDVNTFHIFIFSKFAMVFSKANIFVSEDLMKKSGQKNGYVIPCAIDSTVFYPMDRIESREKLKLDLKKKYVLFSSYFAHPVKDYPLAKKAMDLLGDIDIELIELKNYSRSEVALLLNAVDLALMTSKNEGSPQFIKEAMACCCPIVSTDVGDVKKNFQNVDSCYISSFSPNDISDKIKLALSSNRSNGNQFLEKFDSNKIALSLKQIYTQILV